MVSYKWGQLCLELLCMYFTPCIVRIVWCIKCIPLFLAAHLIAISMQSPLPGPQAWLLPAIWCQAAPGPGEKCSCGNLNISLNHFSPISSLRHEAKNGANEEYWIISGSTSYDSYIMTSLNREKGGGSHGREYFDASDFNCWWHDWY